MTPSCSRRRCRWRSNFSFTRLRTKHTATQRGIGNARTCAHARTRYRRSLPCPICSFVCSFFSVCAPACLPVCCLLLTPAPSPSRWHHFLLHRHRHRTRMDREPRLRHRYHRRKRAGGIALHCDRRTHHHGKAHGCQERACQEPRGGGDAWISIVHLQRQNWNAHHERHDR